MAKKLDKREKRKDKRSTTVSDIEKLAKFLTGERDLEKKQKKIEEAKRVAIERRKERTRLGIENGNIKLEEIDDEETELRVKKVVQNVKLFSWDAPERRPIKFENKTFLSVVALCLLFMLYLAVVGQYFLMAVIIALLFLLYVLGVTPVINLTHIITARGMDVFGKLFEWYMLKEFWFTEKDGQSMLQISTNLRLPGRLTMLLDKKDRGAIFVILQDRLLYRDVRKQSWLEKLNDGIFVPLEKI